MPSFTSVSCVAPVEGVTFQHCVYLTIILEHGNKWRFGVGAAVSGSSVTQRCERLVTYNWPIRLLAPAL